MADTLFTPFFNDGIPTTDDDTPSGPMQQYVSFTVGGSEFAVDILAIREFKRWTETTPLPNTPPYVRGVINLRGVVVPIYDLRARFGQGPTQPTATHVIMMVAVSERTVGLLVDAVDDVLTVPQSALSAVPETDSTASHPFLQAVLTIDERMIAVLGLERLFSGEVVPPLPLGPSPVSRQSP
ncbi:chemotaxis protein CheW [Insolitispirillum peregrinum]|uniref:Purine-binding chemotaxis protein CheW n=1 Tax=Insolitispirillum peregrinum TaxID=80876 RepID=A0A1N7PMP3_9PROT|nr:chemotaxis protein CheW [Insolitispirillum peregrinum]SIT11831.1 purine-binding chemotaxis protein CheW [Insolitispirillum peregrinum]